MILYDPEITQNLEDFAGFLKTQGRKFEAKMVSPATRMPREM
jgi:hypothetical protein